MPVEIKTTKEILCTYLYYQKVVLEYVEKERFEFKIKVKRPDGILFESNGSLLKLMIKMSPFFFYSFISLTKITVMKFLHF